MLIGILALLVLLAVALDHRLTVRDYSVFTAQVSQPIRLAVITDLHSCAYGEGQRNLLSEVNDQLADVVLFVGDIVDERLPEQRAYTALSALAREYPCYYVTGNHEYRSKQADKIKEKIAALGVHVLEGGWETLNVRGQSLTICGVDDPVSGDFAQQLQRAGEGAAEADYCILLSHRPERIQSYLEYGFDLILSGHAHGGQWRIPGLLNGLYAPNQGLFPRYAGGRCDFGSTTMIVSRGLARESTPVPRIFNPPELVMVELTPETAP